MLRNNHPTASKKTGRTLLAALAVGLVLLLLMIQYEQRTSKKSIGNLSSSTSSHTTPPETPNTITESTPNATVEIPPETTPTKITTRLTLDKFPYYDFTRYQAGETALALDDYALFHKLILNGTLPPRYFIAPNHPGVGLGNRMEQVEWGCLIAILSSRAFISEWNSPFPLSMIINNTNININWTEFSNNDLYGSLKTRIRYEDVDKLLPLVKNGSLIENLGDYEGIGFDAFRAIVVPGQEIYSNPYYKDVIPRVLPVWKVPIVQFLLKTPTDRILNRMRDIKATMGTFTQLVTMQIRTKHWGHSESRPRRIAECAGYFRDEEKARNPNGRTVFYVSADNMESRNLTIQLLGEENVFDSSVGPVHFGELEGQLPVNEIEGVMVDWWLIGDGHVKIISERSTFGNLAADRTYNRRFLVGGETQCVDPDAFGYLQELYVALDRSYATEGSIKHVTEQK